MCAIQAGDTVQALEDDPTIEPIEEWPREHERIIQRKRTGRAYQIRAYQMRAYQMRAYQIRAYQMKE